MKALLAETILTMDAARPIVKNGAILFDEKIIEIADDPDRIAKIKTTAEIIDCGENSIAMPGLINAHAHLEFSANKTALNYGSFIGWLGSVIEKREALIGACDRLVLDAALNEALFSGTTAIGAVSSYGFDLEALAESRQRVVYFNELIGSNPAAADAIWASFLERVDRANEYESDRFKNAIAVHSPYSTHLVLARKAIEIAARRGMPLSTHFMESKGERRWLESGGGEFKPFFEKLFRLASPFCDAKSFLEAFAGVRALFVHCVQANEWELDFIAKNGGSIVHCPVSNRLLGCGLLCLEKVKNRDISYAVATDGLSSNRSLNLFEELRAALLMHEGLDLPLLARDLLRSVTAQAAKALGLNCGKLAPDYAADIISFNLGGSVSDDDSLASLHAILRAPSKMDYIFIGGERIEIA